MSRLTLQGAFKANISNYEPENDLKLVHAFDKYGPIPRNIYAAYSSGGDYKMHDEAFKHEIKDVTLDVLQRIISAAPINAHEPISHKIVSVHRNTNNDESYAAALSKFVIRELMEVSTFKTLENKRQLCELLAGVPHAAVARGWCFEAYSHAILTNPPNNDGPSSIPTFLARATTTNVLDNTKTYSLRFDSNGPGQSLDYARAYRDTVLYESLDDFTTSPVVENKYYVPKASNNPCFDSFDIVGKEAWIFQMTLSDFHRVDTPAQKGLEFLKKILPPSLPWRYILVVPKSTSSPSLTHIPEKWMKAVKSFQVMSIDMKAG